MGDNFEKEVNKLVQDVEKNIEEAKNVDETPADPTPPTLAEQFPSKFKKPISVFIREHAEEPVDQLVVAIRTAVANNEVVPPVDLSTARLKKAIRFYRYRDRRKQKRAGTNG